MARLTVKDMATAHGLGTRAPALGDRCVAQTAQKVPKTFTIGSLSTLDNEQVAAVVPSYDLRTFGSGTAAFQAAVDSGLPVFVPAGEYTIGTINIPIEGCCLYGDGVNTTRLIAAGEGDPLFLWQQDDTIGDWRTGPDTGRIEFRGLRLDVRHPAASQALVGNRCSASGWPIANAAIVIERGQFPTGTGSTAAGLSNLPFGMQFTDLVFGVAGVTTNNNAFSCGIALMGSAPGLYVRNLQALGIPALVVMGPAFMRRCTVAGGTFSPAGGNPFVDGQKVVIRANGTAGMVMPADLSETTVFTVEEATSTDFKLDGFVGSGSSSGVYAILVDDA